MMGGILMWIQLRFFLVCFVVSIYNPVIAAESLVVFCEVGKWEGQRVGFQNDGQIENDDNFQSMSETLFILEQWPPTKGDRVHARYGEDLLYEGEVRYVYSGNNPYIILETQPYDLQENYSIDLLTGNTILTITKRMFGFYKDIFTNKCDIRFMDPQK